MSNIKIEKTPNIEKSILSLCGSLPSNGLIYNGEWTRWGKNYKYSFNGNPNKQSGTLWDWSGEISPVFFYTPNHTGDFKIATPTKKEKESEEDLSKLFKTLSSEGVNNHPYTIKKRISLKNVKLSRDKQRLIIPIYNDDDKLISFQFISQNGEKRFKKGRTLTKAHHFPIGKYNKSASIEDDYIYCCEGVATGATIHQITNKKVYCSFSKGNLDALAKMLLSKYSGQIVMCIDNDEEHTHKTEIKHNRLTIICPSKKGDFNDRPEKRKLLLVENLLKPLSATIKKLEYLDDPYNMIIKGHTTIISGAKTALKSTGLLNYLFKYQLNIAYFSDWEVSEQTLRKRAKAVNAENKIYRINLNSQKSWDNIGKIIKAGNLDCIIEDPPFENEKFNNIPGTRELLAIREKIAQQYNISWLIVRNYSKTMDQNSLKKVSGFAVWTNMPRSTIIFFPLESGHKYRPVKTHDEKTNKEIPKKEQYAPKVSLMQCMVCNEGVTPKHSALLKIKTTQIEEDVNKSMIDVPLCEIEMIKRPEDPERWVKVRTQEENEKFDTKVWEILSCVNDKGDEGITPYELVKRIVSKNELALCGRSTAYKILKHLHDENYIEGGGAGGAVGDTKVIKITKLGKEYLE